MQNLGLSESTPKTESRLKTLFWPTIRNEFDLDYITRQGFWICVVVGLLSFAMGLFAGQADSGQERANHYADAGNRALQGQRPGLRIERDATSAKRKRGR